ncbi:hypothetical protein OsJ_00028 [Oryza sativa Japonica Group]|uniref:EXPERA domain-containing protein n=1 Tax=Oryza sativa subsp. japonica TaxID=39947 RepID=B9EYR6_ORYSJ|nr:hypothetical protein OsJ_00028 [Oryza sativa Japonica Group]
MGHPHPHPYAPAELHLPGFVPLQLSQAQILVPYLATSLFLLLAVWLISGRCSRRLSDTDRWLMCWWAFTGLTHIIIEGTFVFAPNFFSNQNPSYFDEVSYLDGFNFWTSPFYFWAYFIGANSSWVVIPTMIAIRSWKKICAAFQGEKVKTK